MIANKHYDVLVDHLREVESAALALTGVIEYGMLSDDWETRETRARELAKTLRVLIMDRKPHEPF